MHDISRFSLKRKVNLVVQVLDDFTDRPIADSGITVSADGYFRSPIRKSGGYYVFADSEQSTLAVEVKGLFYHPVRREIDTRALDPLHPLVKIRMQPSRSYNLPSGSTSIYGQAAPFSRISLIGDGGGPMKLLYDYDAARDGAKLCLFNPDNADLEGKSFAIMTKPKDSGEVFTVLEHSDPERGEYVIEPVLNMGYKKSGTEILPVYTTVADEKGEYFIALKANTAKEETVTMETETDGEITAAPQVIKWGQANRIDLTA
ncbi:MAG: hypothetical protein Q4B48_01430 [Syntrophomonadaceae bacterium]|nr:hypothetical protein [Syntrophomonadaceae bacterium]